MRGGLSIADHIRRVLGQLLGGCGVGPTRIACHKEWPCPWRNVFRLILSAFILVFLTAACGSPSASSPTKSAAQAKAALQATPDHADSRNSVTLVAHPVLLSSGLDKPGIAQVTIFGLTVRIPFDADSRDHGFDFPTELPKDVGIISSELLVDPQGKTCPSTTDLVAQCNGLITEALSVVTKPYQAKSLTSFFSGLRVQWHNYANVHQISFQGSPALEGDDYGSDEDTLQITVVRDGIEYDFWATIGNRQVSIGIVQPTSEPYVATFIDSATFSQA